MTAKNRNQLRPALLFLAPNIIGFLVFSLVPLVLSLVMAFTNWDLTLHNMFKENPVKFIGLENFLKLFLAEDFWRFFGNTMYLLLLIPFKVAGSLFLAVMLTGDLTGGKPRTRAVLVVGAIFVTCTVMLVLLGAGSAAMTIVLSGMAVGLLLFGSLGGSTFYRTMFYMPHFTAGVATFILWKKLYNPVTGPINSALRGPLSELSDVVNATPAPVVQACYWILLLAALGVQILGFYMLRSSWRDGEIGTQVYIVSAIFLLIASWVAWLAAPPGLGWIYLLATLLMVAYFVTSSRGSAAFSAPPLEGVGSGLMLSGALLTLALVLVGLGRVMFYLPAMAADGLEPPQWIASYEWAKPSILIMMLWGSIGSNFMLLYIAGISNIPQDLYEAAGIDGASGFQRFWYITWPQLAPTTFFIVVMATIDGLRGGFEMARTMTEGGPAGSTTFLSYYIYVEGFDSGRLGFASAVAWTLFAMTFAITVFNWKFGNKYVND